MHGHYLIAHHREVFIIVSVHIHGPMEINTLGNGKITKEMVKELILGPMERNTLGNGKITKEMVKEIILGPMERST